MIARPTSAHSRAGFTLIELIVVVTIIGLLCAIAIPAYNKLHNRSRNTRMVNDLRIASGALELFVFEKGYWPPDGAGGWPEDITGYLPPPDRWNQPTPIGGKWAWSLSEDNSVAALRINNYTASADQILNLDQMMDDGNTGTGSVITAGLTLSYFLKQ